MKTSTELPRRQTAFTLIELLIVIAIIGVLAGLLMPVISGIGTIRMKRVAYAELIQITTAIKAYQSAKGFYPPDSSTNTPLVNALYYELVGTTNHSDGNSYGTLDGKDTVTVANLKAYFGLGNLANSAKNIRATDDAPAPYDFLKGLKPDQIGDVGPVKVLQCSEGWTKPGAVTAVAPWRYNASHPTNNPGSYDLWVDLFIKGKTNRISNWSKEPQVVN